MIWKRNSLTNRAFTLVEMLVVIAIIAVLATLVTGGMARAKSARERSRVKAELNMLVTAIDSYKQKLGFYPPDNPQDPQRPPLFYELTGTVREGNNFVSLVTLGGEKEEISPADVKSAFNVGGFSNSSTDRDQVFNFAKTLKPQQMAELEGVSGDIEVIIVPVDGPDVSDPAKEIRGRITTPEGNKVTRKINTWRYISTNPTNNPNSFDLWAEIKNGKDVQIIGNW